MLFLIKNIKVPKVEETTKYKAYILWIPFFKYYRHTHPQRSGFWDVPKIHLLELKRRQTREQRPSCRKWASAWQGDRPVRLHLSPSLCRPCIDTSRHKQLLNIPPRSSCLIPSVFRCPPGRVDKRDGTFRVEDMNHYASSFRDRSHAHWFYRLNWLY